ncbi:hypothetical protein FOZ63_007109 [Perkinsus olseni]|uniref:Cathepsin L n=1 Tax=Perkinsus olseni TaxID=32597 RepID=A0A7J6R3G5_PEROL|nr:hypothetical protein FOZ62_026717 [Perkinsus olseni]KAF4744321.1 hypothetical protein FOZ63_007109 [Perkinsus olseni]
MVRIVLLLLSFIPLYQSMDEAVVDLAFVGFQAKHGKRYKDEAEKRKRAKIFQSNMEYIEKVNAQNLSYTLGVNQYSDLTFDEFAAQMLHPIEVDDGMQERLPVKVGSDRVGAPTSVDWRGKGVLNPIKDQGQCGSCWAFSANGALEAQYAITKKKLLSFSEKQLNDCSSSYGNQGCRGGLMEYAYKYIRDKGIDLESTYPYEDENDTCDSSLQSKADGLPVGEVTGFTFLSKTDSALVEAVAKAPVSVALYANKAFHHYSQGVFSDTSCNGHQMNHAAVVVGYGSQGGDDYYIIRNSWGTDWGQKGYMYLKRGVSGEGQCSILNYMLVPTLKPS